MAKHIPKNPSHPIHFKLIVVSWCICLFVDVTYRQLNVWSKLFEIFTDTHAFVIAAFYYTVIGCKN